MPKKRGKTSVPLPFTDNHGCQMDYTKHIPEDLQQAPLPDGFDYEFFKESFSDFFDCTTSSVKKVAEMWGSDIRCNKCSYCQRERDSLKKCTVCRVLYYCSQVCQNADWPQHRMLCQPSKKEEGKESRDWGYCFHCDAYRHDLKKCVKCKTAAYCGKQCQRADWPEHRKLCAQMGGENGNVGSANSNAEGNGAAMPPNAKGKGTMIPPNAKGKGATMPPNAKGKGATMPPNARGKGATMPPDAKGKGATMPPNVRGKGATMPPNAKGKGATMPPTANYTPTYDDDEANTPPLISSCMFCEKKRPKRVKCPKCKIAEYCDDRCRSNHHLQHKVACGNFPKFYNVLSNASEILADYHRCTSTQMVFPSQDCHIEWSRAALLVEIVEPCFHPFRHAVFVRDVNDELAPMFFYHDATEEVAMLPKKLASALTPGNFIRWFSPHWHYFMDGHVGFRIDSLTEVELLRKTTKFTFFPS